MEDNMSTFRKTFLLSAVLNPMAFNTFSIEICDNFLSNCRIKGVRFKRILYMRWRCIRIRFYRFLRLLNREIVKVHNKYAKGRTEWTMVLRELLHESAGFSIIVLAFAFPLLKTSSYGISRLDFTSYNEFKPPEEKSANLKELPMV